MKFSPAAESDLGILKKIKHSVFCVNGGLFQPLNPVSSSCFKGEHTYWELCIETWSLLNLRYQPTNQSRIHPSLPLLFWEKGKWPDTKMSIFRYYVLCICNNSTICKFIIIRIRLYQIEFKRSLFIKRIRTMHYSTYNIPSYTGRRIPFYNLFVFIQYFIRYAQHKLPLAENLPISYGTGFLQEVDCTKQFVSRTTNRLMTDKEF